LTHEWQLCKNENPGSWVQILSSNTSKLSSMRSCLKLYLYLNSSPSSQLSPFPNPFLQESLPSLYMYPCLMICFWWPQHKREEN
jgi:hypothetical protein